MNKKCREYYDTYTSVVSKNTRKLLYSKLFIVFVILVISTTVLITAFVPLFGGTPINDEWTNAMRLMLLITYIVAVSGILGDLMMDRASKVALPLYITYIILYGFQCYVWALYYEMLQQALVFILVVISLLNWGRKNNHNDDIQYLKFNYFIIVLLILLIITVLLGSIMEWIINPWIGDNIILDINGNIDYENTGKLFWRGVDPYPFLDAFVFVIFIGAWILFTKRYYNAFWLMFICIIGYFFVYGLMAIEQGINSYWVYLVTNVFYLFLNQTGMSNWTVIYNQARSDSSWSE